MPNSNTIIPDGPKIRQLRLNKGWNRETMCWQTEQAAMRIAAREPLDSPMNQRLCSRDKKNQTYGIGIGALKRIENESKPVLPVTLRIIAETLDVPVDSLIATKQAGGTPKDTTGDSDNNSDGDSKGSWIKDRPMVDRRITPDR